MAKISRKDLEHLTSEQIKEFFTSDDKRKLISPIKEYIEGGEDNFSIGNRVNRVEKILTLIVMDRFINGTL